MDKIFKISLILLLEVRSPTSQLYRIIIVFSYFHKSVLISFLKELQENYFNLMSQKNYFLSNTSSFKHNFIFFSFDTV